MLVNVIEHNDIINCFFLIITKYLKSKIIFVILIKHLIEFISLNI